MMNMFEYVCLSACLFVRLHLRNHTAEPIFVHVVFGRGLVLL